VLNAVINSAIKENIIHYNPCRVIKLPKLEDYERVYLTLSELKSLVQTDCKDAELKRAFIFSCLTGLRWSDVYKLKWSEIQESEGKYSIVYSQKKTA